jgi:uncharacterized membrane protein YjgN (DUF898 family)
MRGAFKFNGNGGELFSIVIVNFLLSVITCGIYLPWAIVKITRYMASKTTLDGVEFSFEGSGGELFSLYLIQGILTAVTFGLYSPWAVAKIANYYMNNTTLGDNGKFTLDLQGGDLFSIVVLHGIILTVITFGLYAPWFIVKFTEYEYSKMELVDA